MFEEKINFVFENRRTYESERIVIRSLVVFGKTIDVDFESKLSVDDASISAINKDDSVVLFEVNGF